MHQQQQQPSIVTSSPQLAKLIAGPSTKIARCYAAHRDRHNSFDSVLDASCDSMKLAAADHSTCSRDPIRDVCPVRLFMAGAMAGMLMAFPLHATPAHVHAESSWESVSGTHLCFSTPQQEAHTLFWPKLVQRQQMTRNKFQGLKSDSPVLASSMHTNLSTQALEGLQAFEQVAESSGIDYEQLIQEHDDGAVRRKMFTGDAWLGMMRLQKYNDLVDSLEQEEKLCGECVRNRRLLEQVWQTVSNEYFDQYGRFAQAEWSGELFKTLDFAGGLLHSKAETYKAVKGMVARLQDPYSSFLSPEEYRFALHRPIQSELKYLAYQYTGVGMEIGKRHPKGGFKIVAPFAGSPAEEAGILGGERLLSVDGLSVDNLTADEAVTLLRGPIGSLVELEIIDAKPSAISRKVIIERRALPLPPLRMDIINAPNGRLIAYLRLHYFTHDGTKKMASAIREGESLGVDGYIVDLRNNPGGVFEEAIAMAAFWLDCVHCGIAETVRSNAADIDDFLYVAGSLPSTIFSQHPGVLTHAPMVTISNRNSASASEVLIGALQDNGRTLVIGEKTFGKGVVQYFFPMDDGSGLKLTVAKYLTPNRYDISKQGGLLPNTFCSDFPHAKGILDECVREAITRLRQGMDMEQKEHRRTSSRFPTATHYRWLPLDHGKLHTKESY